MTGRRASCRALAADVWDLFSESRFQADLGDLAGLNEEYYLLDEGICGIEAEIDERVRQAAKRFLEDPV